MKAIFMTLCPRVFQINKKGDNMFDNVVLHRNSRSWINAFVHINEIVSATKWINLKTWNTYIFNLVINSLNKKINSEQIIFYAWFGIDIYLKINSNRMRIKIESILRTIAFTACSYDVLGNAGDTWLIFLYYSVSVLYPACISSLIVIGLSPSKNRARKRIDY